MLSSSPHFPHLCCLLHPLSTRGPEANIQHTANAIDFCNLTCIWAQLEVIHVHVTNTLVHNSLYTLLMSLLLFSLSTTILEEKTVRKRRSRRRRSQSRRNIRWKEDCDIYRLISVAFLGSSLSYKQHNTRGNIQIRTPLYHFTHVLLSHSTAIQHWS